MATKFKITGFARLILFLLLFAPIAYFGASYLTGENGVSKLKEKLGGKENTSVVRGNTDQEALTKSEETIRKLQKENAQLKQKIAELEAQMAE